MSDKDKELEKSRQKVNNLIFSVDVKDGQSGILCLDTLEIFCICSEENADIILNSIIKAYKM